MDNTQQIREIKKYRQHLCRMTGKSLSMELVARIWIRKYADAWRKRHPLCDAPMPRQTSYPS
jgi:hypothetical protein